MSNAGFVCMVTGRAGRGRARRNPNFSCAAAAAERPEAARVRRIRSATRPGRCGRRIRGTERLRRRAGSTHARASSTAAPGGPATPGRLSRSGPRRAGRAIERAAPGRLAASGGPSTLAARSGRRCCGTRHRGPWRPEPRRSPRCCRPVAHQLGRQQDLGGRAVENDNPIWPHRAGLIWPHPRVLWVGFPAR